MSWLLVVVFAGEMQMHSFTSERSCNNAGHVIAHHWKILNPPPKKEININWTCIRQ